MMHGTKDTVRAKTKHKMAPRTLRTSTPSQSAPGLCTRPNSAPLTTVAETTFVRSHSTRNRKPRKTNYSVSGATMHVSTPKPTRTASEPCFLSSVTSSWSFGWPNASPMMITTTQNAA